MSGEFTPARMNGPGLGHDRPSPSHEMTREERRLEGDFPGVDNDTDVQAVFRQLGYYIHVVQISNEDPDLRIREVPYAERGNLDYTIIVRRNLANKGVRGLKVNHYEVNHIYPTEMESLRAGVLLASQAVTASEVHRALNSPLINDRLQQIRERIGDKVIYK